MLLLLRVCRCRQMGGYILLLQIVEPVNFDGSMWLDHNSPRSLYRRRSQPPIFFPGLFLGVLANDIVIWFWIGSHDNYERLIRELR